MREIKFRVWRKKHNAFVSPYHFGMRLSISGDLYSELDGNMDVIVIQQFTGLKDKNGKEIYEGDILVFNGNMEKEFQTHTDVIFSYGEFVGRGLVSSLVSQTSCAEVVGNIFENPELIEK